MGKTRSEVKNRWANAHYDRVTVIVPKGEKEAWKEEAKKKGQTLSEYVREAVNRARGEHLSLLYKMEQIIDRKKKNRHNLNHNTKAKKEKN